MDIVFFGTHNFAAVILQGLIDNPVVNIKKVITQPDKPAGRRQKARASEIKILARKYKLKIEQPADFKNYDLKIKNYDLNIVVDYGRIIPAYIIERPRFGSINIHPSLLPKYRGPSPIQTALMKGDKETGVTIMLIDEKMDHGPILAQEAVKIDSHDNYLTLSRKLSRKASGLLTGAIPKYIAGKLKAKPQNHILATYCKMLDRDSGLLDFNKKAGEIYNLHRALNPWPGIWTKGQGKRLKFLKIGVASKKIPPAVIFFHEGHIFVGCNDKSIEIMELQPEGGKPMTASSFINGHQNLNGSKLGF